MDECNAELCINWTGSAWCVCDVMELNKDEARVAEETADETSAPTCDMCDDLAEFRLDMDDVSSSGDKYACAQHLAHVCRAVIENWGEHGVICIMSATED